MSPTSAAAMDCFREIAEPFAFDKMAEAHHCLHHDRPSGDVVMEAVPRAPGTAGTVSLNGGTQTTSGASPTPQGDLIHRRAADGTYLELTSPISRSTRVLFEILRGIGLLRLLEWVRPGLMHRFYAWFGGPIGLQDWCVRVPGLDVCRRTAEQAGVSMADTRAFRRTRPDGEVAEWRLTAPTDRQEPFWIEDVSPVELRVPWRAHCTHQNGAEGIRAVVLRSVPSLALDGVSFRVADPAPGHRLRLELHASGGRKGLLPLAQTANAWIELV